MNKYTNPDSADSTDDVRIIRGLSYPPMFSDSLSQQSARDRYRSTCKRLLLRAAVLVFTVAALGTAVCVQ